MTLDATETVVIAGWYPDPSNRDQARWWDGTNWTDSVKPLRLEPEPEPDRYFSSSIARKEAALPPIDPFRPSDHRYSSQGFVSMEAKKVQQLRPTRAYTSTVWWLATMPLWATVIVVALVLILGPNFNLFPRLITGLVLVFLGAALTVQDRKGLLDQLHPTAASAFWFLLGPFIYLIARAVHVTHHTGRGWAPVIVYAMCSIVPVSALLAFTAIFAFYAGLVGN